MRVLTRQMAVLFVAAVGLYCGSPGAGAAEVDLVAAAQGRDARLAQLRSTSNAAPDVEQQIDAIRHEDPWSPSDGPAVLALQPSDTEFHPFNFAVLSDLHLSERKGPQRLQKALDLLSKRHDIAFVLVLGDIVWDRDPEKLKPMLAAANVPVHLVYGNNDWKWVSNGTYEKSFGPRDYTFTYDNCTFVAMYDCLPKGHFPEDHKGDFNERQWSWLEQQLKDAREQGRTHTFVAMHIPPKTPGAFDPFFFMFENTEKRFFDLLERYKVSAGLFGHLHQAAAWKHDDIQCYVTPSCCWNFATRTQKVDSSFVRIVKVEQDQISSALLPVHLDGETYTWDTLPQFYNPADHPK